MEQTEFRDAVEQIAEQFRKLLQLQVPGNVQHGSERGALVEKILDILSPQLDREPLVTAAQHIELHSAIARFAANLRIRSPESDSLSPV